MADAVWVLVMFDLPTLTKKQRRDASHYRLMLREMGFYMVQLSIYAKYLVNASGLRAMVPDLKKSVPPNGQVRVIRLTDEQWAGTYRYYGPITAVVERPPEQLALFSDRENENWDW